jgi:hypothetical protein
MPSESSGEKIPCLMNATVLPNHHRIEFLMNVESGWYHRQPQRIAFGKLPDKLKVEKTIDPRIIANGAREVITGGFKAKKRTFFTGLIPLDIEGWFMGNDCEFRSGRKCISLVLFRFDNSDSELSVYYFTGWYKENPSERRQFSNQFARMAKCSGIKNGGK